MKRLQLAYAWGKWIALRREEYEKAMDYYKSQRPRGNWAILVERDEMACRYQRCVFRVHRALRAVGAWGMTGYATFDDQNPNATVKLVGVDFPVNAASADQLAAMNARDFQKNDRTRAVEAKRVAEDKRHPLADFMDHCAQEDQIAYEAELQSMRY